MATSVQDTLNPKRNLATESGQQAAQRRVNYSKRQLRKQAAALEAAAAAEAAAEAGIPEQTPLIEARGESLVVGQRFPTLKGQPARREAVTRLVGQSNDSGN
jgi:hypothetical protein